MTKTITYPTYPTRRWALTSLVEWSGKTTFMASNVHLPAFIIDADNRWHLASPLVEGQTKLASGIDIMDPLALMEAIDREMSTGIYKTICCDPVTKLYSIQSRRASMAGRLSKAEREKRGYGKNVAKLHVGKADTIEVLANMAMYGTDCLWSWHRRHGVDAQGVEGDRDRISETELNVLRQSIDVELLFSKRVNPSWQSGNREAQQFLYGITVSNARGMSGLPLNTQFTIWDRPGNFWRGGARRLERLIYTSFRNPKEAIDWAKGLFTGDPPVDLAKEYETKKKEWKPEVSGQMYSAWVEHLDYLVAAASGEKVQEPEPVQEPATSPAEAKYEDGSKVAKKDIQDVAIYRKLFGRRPYDYETLDRARQMGQEKNNWG